MKAPDLKAGQMITIAYFVGILIVLFIVYKFLGKIGLIKTADKKKQEENETKAAQTLRTSIYFNPLYLKDKMNTYTKLPGADLYTKEIHQAISGVGTNEEKLYSVFGRLKNKENISEIALRYMNAYNSDLQADLLNELSDSEMVTINDIISKLPNK